MQFLHCLSFTLNSQWRATQRGGGEEQLLLEPKLRAEQLWFFFFQFFRRTYQKVTFRARESKRRSRAAFERAPPPAKNVLLRFFFASEASAWWCLSKNWGSKNVAGVYLEKFFSKVQCSRNGPFCEAQKKIFSIFRIFSKYFGPSTHRRFFEKFFFRSNSFSRRFRAFWTWCAKKKFFDFWKFFQVFFSSTLTIFWKNFFFAQTYFGDVLDDSKHDERKKNFWNFWNFPSTSWRFFDPMSSIATQNLFISVLAISRWSFCAQIQLIQLSESTSMSRKLTYASRHLSMH